MLWERNFLFLDVYPKFLRGVSLNLTLKVDYTEYSQSSYLPVLYLLMLVLCFWGPDTSILDFHFPNSCTDNLLEPPETAEVIDTQIPLQYKFRRSWELRETGNLTCHRAAESRNTSQHSGRKYTRPYLLNHLLAYCQKQVGRQSCITMIASNTEKLLQIQQK